VGVRIATQTAIPEPKAGDGSGFAKHGVKHLSASSINLWINAPDMWVAKYLHGFKSSFGPAPKRGQCVEDAVAHVLNGGSFEDGLKAAHKRFDQELPTADDKVTKERDLIEPMAQQAIAELQPYGKPDFPENGQHKISINANFDGWSIPLVGFLDFVFPQHGLVVDLKTTTRVPSTMSADHQLQRAIYHRAKGNQSVQFLYTSAKKSAWPEDGDPADVLARAKHQIARMDRFLAHCDKETALRVVPHNPSSFYWRDDPAAMNKIFGT
jgi:hypothetical protein